MFLLIRIKHFKKENTEFLLLASYLCCNETQTIGKNMFDINVATPCMYLAYVDSYFIII